MKMLCLAMLGLLFPPVLSAQDLSKYRSFSLGMNLATTLKQTGQELHHVDVLCEHPAVIQEVTWWPRSTPVNTRRSESVEQMLLYFFNGELYKISVIYDQHAIEGLTDEDMVKSISALYGVPTTIAPGAVRATDHRFDMKQRVIASWTGSHYTVRLLSDPVADDMELLLFSQQDNTKAEAAMIEARSLDAQDFPQKQGERQKEEAHDLELTRQKNMKAFEP